jgi:hypothetical protein
MSDEIVLSVADSHERSALKRRFPGLMRLDSRWMDSLPLRGDRFPAGDKLDEPVHSQRQKRC